METEPLFPEGGVWLSLVERIVRDDEAAGSNPVTPISPRMQRIKYHRKSLAGAPKVLGISRSSVFSLSGLPQSMINFSSNYKKAEISEMELLVKCNNTSYTADISRQEERRRNIVENIKIKYFTDQIDKLTYIAGKSDWIDLRASEDVSLKQGEFALIPLGVAMELPRGYEAHIVPRSSTYKNFGVIQANHCGIVDGSYCGDGDMWRMPVIAMRDTEIHVNDRICQFRIMKNQPEIHFDEVEHLEGADRGGFGSTGRR